MDIEIKLLDHFRLTHHLTRNFACDSSTDDRFSIITDEGVYILALHVDVAKEKPTFSCTKYFLKVSNFAPCSNIDLDLNTFHCELDKEDLYETLLGIEYSQNLKNTKPVDPIAHIAEWSPSGLADEKCLLAVLTNLHSLEIYMRILDENEVTQYIMISNVSQEIIDVEKVKWSCAVRLAIAIKLKEFKKRVHMVTPTIFRWGHLFQVNHKKYSVLFVGHINGDISAWMIEQRRSDTREPSKLKFLGRYSTQVERLTKMYWHQTSDYGGALFFGSIDGRLSVVHVTNLNQNAAFFDKEQLVWSQVDNVRVDEISVIVHGKETFVLATKQRALMIFGIDDKGDLFDFKTVYIKDYYITGLCNFKNLILVMTLPGLLTQVTLSVENSAIIVEEKNIPVKNEMSKYRSHGCFFSKNKVLFYALGYPWDFQSFSKSKNYVNVFIYQNCSVNPFDLLWNNETDSLTNYWDCFEALRLICLKEKQFPWVGLPPDLNYDELPLVKLKTLRLLAKMSEMVFKSIPIVMNYRIKPFIILHYLVEIKLVVKRMEYLLGLLSSSKPLTEFQMRSMRIQNFFLKEMVMKDILPKANVGRRFISEIRSVMELANELKYPDMMRCIWCEEKIVGPTCLPPHSDSRCCFSMMPIMIIPAYKCPFCGCVAHKEVEREMAHEAEMAGQGEMAHEGKMAGQGKMARILCPFCDVCMDRIRLRDSSLQEEYLDCKEVRSDCFEDCLREEGDVEEVGENDAEYVMISDSEEEGGGEEIAELYLEFSKTRLTELLQKNVDEVEPEVALL